MTVFVLWSLLPGCVGSPTSTPDEVSMYDDAAFTEFRSFVLAEPAAWCGRAAYNPTDPNLVDPEIRKVIQQRNFGKLPATSEQRKRLAFSLANSVWAGKLSRPDWKAAVEARVADYWEHPQVTNEDGGLVADLGLCPGPITAWTGGRYGIPESVYADRGQLRRDLVSDRLQTLIAADRTAKWWELRVQIPVGHRAPEAIRYRYDPVRDVLMVMLPMQPGAVYVSPAPLHGDLEALKTLSPTRFEEMKHLRVGRDIPAP